MVRKAEARNEAVRHVEALHIPSMLFLVSFAQGGGG